MWAVSWQLGAAAAVRADESNEANEAKEAQGSVALKSPPALVLVIVLEPEPGLTCKTSVSGESVLGRGGARDCPAIVGRASSDSGSCNEARNKDDITVGENAGSETEWPISC